MKSMIAVFFLTLAATSLAEVDRDTLEGGHLDVWPADHGRFLFVNAQKTVDEGLFRQPVSILATELNFDITIQPGAAPEVRGVKAALATLGAKGAIWIVDDASLPLMLGACEDGWGFLNVAPLVADKPDAKKLAVRVEKLVNRTFANIHGIGDSQMSPYCVMKTAVGLAGIDALRCRGYSPEPYGKIMAYMASAGYKNGRHGTYYEACEGGWAPAPTNALQKSIWDEVHQLPTKPIKIVPESQRKSK